MEIDRRSAMGAVLLPLGISGVVPSQAAMRTPPADLECPWLTDATGPVTRAEAQQLLAWITNACLAKASPGYASLKLGESAAWFDDKAAGLEGVSRLLWGVVPALQGGQSLPAAAKLRVGLINGTDPGHPEYWGPMGVGGGQRGVEMAAIATAIHDLPHIFFDPLTARAKANLLDWLSTIATANFPPTNWRWFRILTMEALEKAGRPIDRKIIEAEHALIDSFSIGQGWFRDGASGGVDYYNGLAFQYYSLLFARWRSKQEPDRAKKLIEQARTFAETYIHWFADSGQQLVYGRSLTYRFAALGFWGLLAEIGHPTIKQGQLRDLWSKSMRWWMRQPIWQPAGVPSIGYAFPNLLEQEFYNSPQSPLWMMKAFAPLALPATHPFWQDPVTPFAPADKGYALSRGPQLLKRHDGGPCLLSGVSYEGELRSFEDKYGKFAYTATHGLGVEATRWLHRGYAGDNVLAFSEDGRHWMARDSIESGSLDGDWLVTRWSVPGAKIETRQRFTDWGEERRHIITATRPLRCVATGHAVDLFHFPQLLDTVKHQGDVASAVAIGATTWSDIVTAVPGFRRAMLASAPNSNICFRHAAVAGLVGAVPVGTTALNTALCWGNGTPPLLPPDRIGSSNAT